MIRCGWCGRAADVVVCSHCRRDPGEAWRQRGQEPPDIDVNRDRLARATAEITAEGRSPTIEAIAEHLDVSPRTVRRWREMTH